MTDRDLVLHTSLASPAEVTAARRWCEAELAEVVAGPCVEDTVAAVDELGAVACCPGAMVEVVRDDATVHIEVRGSAEEPRDPGELARQLLAEATERWGIAVDGATVTYWAEIAAI